MVYVFGALKETTLEVTSMWSMISDIKTRYKALLNTRECDETLGERRAQGKREGKSELVPKLVSQSIPAKVKLK